LLVLAALSVAFSPSMYKGGAEIAHAHGFFEFWGTDAVQVFDHHGHLHTHGTPHRPVESAPNTARRFSNVTAGFWPTATALTSEAPEDGPSLSASVTPGGVAGAFAVAIGLLAFLVSLPSRKVGYPVERVAISGRAFAPESPPPRFVFHAI
jgi:hypothetical protein